MARSRNNLCSLTLLGFWLASGVTLWPAAAPAADEHWAFQPPSDAPVAVKDGNNPIDHFILAALKARGLNPAPPADKYVLIRRATYDLTGLPPTLSEVEAFMADTSADAYAKVIDRLLAS